MIETLRHRRRAVLMAVASLALGIALGAVVHAVVPAIRVNGVQMTSLASTPVAAGKQGLWVDNSGTPRLRYDDGATSNVMATLGGGIFTGDITLDNASSALKSASSQSISMMSFQVNGTTPAYILDTNALFSGTTHPIVQIRDQAHGFMEFSASGSDSLIQFKRPDDGTTILGQLYYDSTAALTIKNGTTSSVTFTGAAASMIPATDLTTSLGDSSHGWLGGYLGGAAASRPSCDSSHEIAIWISKGGGGVTDTVYYCLKSAANTYSWVAGPNGG
jgi:hypothetical protein